MPRLRASRALPRLPLCLYGVDRENFTIYFILFPVFYAQRITREGGGREREREKERHATEMKPTHIPTPTQFPPLTIRILGSRSRCGMLKGFTVTRLLWTSQENTENFTRPNWHPRLPRIRRSRAKFLDGDVWWCILRNTIWTNHVPSRRDIKFRHADLL